MIINYYSYIMNPSSKVQDEPTYRLCENTDCYRYPDDEDFDKENEEDYEPRGQWRKCNLCDGYFDDNGFDDILFIEEDPNNREGECDLCGKTNDIVQMKGTGEYLCGSGCDASDNESNDDCCIFNYYICKYCDYITMNSDTDCNECKKEMCMELYQAENQSVAISKKNNK